MENLDKLMELKDEAKGEVPLSLLSIVGDAEYTNPDLYLRGLLDKLKAQAAAFPHQQAALQVRRFLLPFSVAATSCLLLDWAHWFCFVCLCVSVFALERTWRMSSLDQPL